MKRNPSRPRLKVSADGVNVVSHAGTRVLSDLTDEVGLTAGLSAAMAPTKQRGHLPVGRTVVMTLDGTAVPTRWVGRC